MSFRDMKRFFDFLWFLLGGPGGWVLLMLLVLVEQLVNGFDVAGSFWMVVCLFASFFARLCAAVEKLAGIGD